MSMYEGHAIFKSHMCMTHVCVQIYASVEMRHVRKSVHYLITSSGSSFDEQGSENVYSLYYVISKDQ